ncbi:MAG: hypothetical protein CMI56_00750 [Parcubacteria group bacterium]|nr:hypothetical protein [Parcubacteria group bacterium]|tara:strand:- start:772 stop:1044 length:273 start_codon:yes stop_codon:yes gene_type:complete
MNRAEIIKRQLNTEEDVKSWLQDMQNNGLNYHYDDNPKEIVDHSIGGGERVFDDDEAKSLSSKLNDCEKIVGSWTKFWSLVPMEPFPEDE